MTTLNFVEKLNTLAAIASDLICKGANAKACIEALSAVEVESEVLQVALNRLGKLSGRNKKESVQILHDFQTEVSMVLDEQEVEAVTDLAAIEAEILVLNKTAAEALLRIGALLNTARAEFDKAKEFLTWAEDKFGYKKAYVYRLMAAADKFGDKPEFEGVAIRVLTIVAGLPEELQAEAAELAQAGELDTKAAEELQAKAAPAPAEAPKGISPAVTLAEVKGTAQAQTEAADDTPWGTEEDLGEDFGEDFAPAPADVALTVPAKPAAEVSALDELRGNPDQLIAIIKALQEEIRLANSKPAKVELPWLPQFTNSCFAARLGLSEEQAKSKQAVRTAFRDLVKIGYGAEHQAHPHLKAALDALTN